MQVIRNETLLLLSSLTRTNEEVKKIVVFEGAFDRLLAIIKEEVIYTLPSGQDSPEYCPLGQKPLL